MNIQNVPYIQPPIGHIVKAKLIGLPVFKPIPPAINITSNAKIIIITKGMVLKKFIFVKLNVNFLQ